MDNLLQLLVDEIILWGPKIVAVFFIFLSFWLLSKAAQKLLDSLSQRLSLNQSLSSLLSRTVNVIILIFGAVTALGTLGIDVSALVAGLGLTGFALGFALKDTIANLLSGVLILLYRPFEIGEHIIISGFQGTVVTIDLRYTELDCEGDRLLIPNSKLFTDPIRVVASPKC